MSKDELLTYLTSSSQSYNFKKTAAMLLIGIAVGLIIYITYYICSEKVTYNRRFNLSILATLLITDLIMMLISTNIAVSLGMVGALSIVRFRTAIKDSRDTIFLFWAIAEGLCVGTRSYKMAFVSIAIIALVMIIGTKTAGIRNKYLLIISGTEDINSEDVTSKLNEYVLSSRVRSANKNHNNKEYIYEIKTKKEVDLKMIDELSSLKGIDSVNWVIETGETIG